MFDPVHEIPLYRFVDHAGQINGLINVMFENNPNRIGVIFTNTTSSFVYIYTYYPNDITFPLFIVNSASNRIFTWDDIGPILTRSWFYTFSSTQDNSIVSSGNKVSFSEIIYNPNLGV